MMQGKHEDIANDICKFINIIRGLDDHGVNTVSTLIAAELSSYKSEQRKIFSIVKQRD